MRKMRKRDARALDHKTAEEFRRLGVQLVKDGGTHAEVARQFQVHPRTVAKWVAAEKRGGAKALMSTKSSGRPKALDNREISKLRDIIVGKNPLQLSFGTALWTVPIVQDVIREKFGKSVHL